MALSIRGKTRFAAGSIIRANPFDNYKVGSFSPLLVSDFAGVNNNDNEYYRKAGSVSTFSDMFTHSRGGNATMVDSDGLIKWAPHNLVKYSEDFRDTADAGETRPWSYNNADITPDSVSAPNQTATADTLTDDTTNGFHTVRTSNFAGTDRRTVAVFAKAGSSSFLQILYSNTVTAGAYATVVFDLSTVSASQQATGASGTIFGSPSIDSVGDGWFLCRVDMQVNQQASVIFSIAPAATGNSFGPTGYITYTGASDTIHLWGAHLYRSDLGGMVNNPDRGDSYVPTTSAAVYQARRNHHTWDGSAWVNSGLLLETEARTNLALQSNQFDTTWALSGGTRTQNETGIDGQATAWTLESSSNACYLQQGFTVVTSTAYTFSVFAKAKTTNWIHLRNTSSFTTPSAGGVWFDLSSGVVGTENTGYSGAIEDVGNGWYRCSSTFTTDASDTTGDLRIVVAGSDGSALCVSGDSILIYGAQFEAGATPSSYMPTAGATSTRPTESLQIAAADMPWDASNVSLQMQGGITYADVNINPEQVFYSWGPDNGTFIKNRFITNSGTGMISAQVRDAYGSLNVFNTAGSGLVPGIQEPFNQAFRVTSVEANIALDGTSGTAIPFAGNFPDLSGYDFYFGPGGAGETAPYMGTIAQFRAWNVDIGDSGIEQAST